MSNNENYKVIDAGRGVPAKAWTKGVPFEDGAREQVLNVARLPFIHKWVAVMPDVHAGKGATIASVIPSVGAIVPAAVGVDIGCGMMANVVEAVAKVMPMAFETEVEAVNCHHNYVACEHHFGKNVWVTRKGAVRAAEGDLGIIPGSMGARSYIVRGKGNADSFHSCSHGAARLMSRTEARRRFSVEDHAKATAGVECRKDKGVMDETPAAYKSIDAVMEAQRDLVDVAYTLRQVVCVKG